MRVRITGCHPYSAGLAAVSGQCYRYISIITFGRAAQRSAAFRSLACASARISASVSRDPICIATCPVQMPVAASVTPGLTSKPAAGRSRGREPCVLRARKSGKTVGCLELLPEIEGKEIANYAARIRTSTNVKKTLRFA